MVNNSSIGFRMILGISIVFLFSISPIYAAGVIESKAPVNPVPYSQMLNWSLGLIVVLSIFFAGVWFMRKMGALPMQDKENMKVVGGLSIGMREKLVLVQVGKKQLVLAVTPGKIDNLLVLEGEAQLYQEKQERADDYDFSGKLKQIMTRTISE